MDSTSNKIGFAFILNLLFAGIEIAGGLFTNSIAIISDAVHDFGDSLSLGVAYFLEKKSVKKGDKKYSYGYRRFSLLGSIFISLVLFTGSVFVVTESVRRLMDPQPVHASGMILLSLIGIIVNGAAVLKLKGGKSFNARAVFLHMMEDVLGWIAVLAGSIIMLLTGSQIIDPILSIVITVWVLYNVLRNLSATLKIMLQEVPDSVDVPDLVNEIMGLDYVDSLHDLHIWSLDGERHVLTLHVVLNGDQPLSILTEYKEKIRNLAQEKGISHTTIEFENRDESCHCGYNGLC
jgi:cobalt-zinc-cadmium efflux system protein